MKKVLVIGASNVDIVGVAGSEMILHDSNPGTIEMVCGGVGKNIAENLYHLEVPVELVTFIGGGEFGQRIIQHFETLGLPYHQSIIDSTKETGKFLSIHNQDGSIIAGINDFGFVDSIEKELLYPIEEYINGFDTLCFDTNLSEEVLVYLIEKFKDKTIIVDGVSQVKVKRIYKVLKYIDILKVNRNELSSILGMNVEDVILGVRKLLEQGLKHVIVTSGKEAITYNIEKRIYQTLVFDPQKIVSSIGAGDALLSGIIYGLCHEKSMHEALNYGKKAASYTMEVRQACHPHLSRKIIEE